MFIVTGAGLYFYFQAEKAKVEERKREDALHLRIILFLNKRLHSRSSAG
jgi:hypothetical protein